MYGMTQNAVNALKAQKGNRRNRNKSDDLNLTSSPNEVRTTNMTLAESLRFVTVFMNSLLKEVQFLHLYTEKVSGLLLLSL
jgi:hypothetical protein